MEYICVFAESQLYGAGGTPQEAYEHLCRGEFVDNVEASECVYYQLGKRVSVEVKLVITERLVIANKGKLP